MVSSENLVLDSLAKPSRHNHAFNGTYYKCKHTHHTHTQLMLWVNSAIILLHICCWLCDLEWRKIVRNCQNLICSHLKSFF